MRTRKLFGYGTLRIGKAAGAVGFAAGPVELLAVAAGGVALAP